MNIMSNYHTLFKKYLEMKCLSEGLIHPDVFPDFNHVNNVCDQFHNYLIAIFSDTNKFSTLLKIWNIGQEISLKYTLENQIITIYFERGNFDPDTLASFNPLSQPFEMCINFSQFDKNFDQYKILKCLRSTKFKSLLAHEFMHFEQTQLYGLETMRNMIINQNSSLLAYQNSVAEVEACVFMTAFAAKSENKTIGNFEELLSYLKSQTESYYDTAKRSIFNNISMAQDIFEHNLNYLKENEEQEIKIELLEIEGIDPKTRNRDGLIKSYFAKWPCDDNK